MIVVDTSALIDCFTGKRAAFPRLREFVHRGDRIALPAIVLYEWWRGPRSNEELRTQELVLPSGHAIPFGLDEAAISARLYRSVKRGRGREMDLAIAACAISWNAELWTINRKDFADIPDLRLVKSE